MPDKNVIDHLTRRFGNQTKLAAAAGVSQPTISERRKSNSLTHGQMRRILKAGPSMGVDVTPGDFFPELVAANDDCKDRAA